MDVGRVPDDPDGGGVMTTREDMLRNLQNLPPADFQTLVAKNLDRIKHANLWELLTHPALVRRTHNVLTALYRDVEDQLAERRAEMESYRQECYEQGEPGKEEWYRAEGEHQHWRRRAIGYRRVVNRRLRETKELVTTGQAVPSPPDPTRKVRQLDTVFRLAWAIEQHRTQTLERGLVPDDHDVALWRCLESVLVDTAGDGVMSVAKFLHGVTSDPGFVPPQARGEVA